MPSIGSRSFSVCGPTVWNVLPDCLKPCPHLFPKQETLYPETGDFVAVFGNEIACSGYKVSCFGNKCGQAFKNPTLSIDVFKR